MTRAATQAEINDRNRGYRDDMTDARASNFDVALKAEMKNVIRNFQRFGTDQISLLYSIPGNPCRKALDRGEFFYSHPSAPGIAFQTRSAAARHALRISQ